MRALKNFFNIKDEKDFIFRIISILSISILLSCQKCKQPFEPNPNLRLLLKEEGYNLGNPVWTKSGWIYYTAREAPDGYAPYYGDIWRIKEDGSDKEFVVSGNFTSIDVSPSETLIVAIEDGYLLELINLLTLKIDTIDNANSAVFGSNDSFIYYGKGNTLLRFNLNFLKDTILLESEESPLSVCDIYKDSLILYNVGYSYIYDLFTQEELAPKTCGIFRPFNPSYILTVYRYTDFEGDLKLVNYLTGEETYLNAKPYETGTFMFGSIGFNPQGNKIVFSFSEWEKGDPYRPKNLELWILEKF